MRYLIITCDRCGERDYQENPVEYVPIYMDRKADLCKKCREHMQEHINNWFDDQIKEG